jgi:hypothetical protein
MGKISNHILLQKASKFGKASQDPVPIGCKYDFKIGAWIKKDTEELLADTSDMRGLETKKSDIETGEDLKSE